MLVRQTFDIMPPKAFISQLLDNLPLVYIFLWERKDPENYLTLTWDEVKASYSKNSFRTALRKLCNHGLISYKETDSQVFIELVGWDEVNEEE